MIVNFYLDEGIYNYFLKLDGGRERNIFVYGNTYISQTSRESFYPKIF